MSKFVTLVLEPRFNDEYGEYANLPVFNAHGDIVGYVGGEVPESGNPCEFNELNNEGFAFCASATEVVRLKAEYAKLREKVVDLRKSLQTREAENAKLRELVSQLIYCAERVGNEDVFYYQPTRDGCGFDCLANGEHCSFAKLCDRARKLGVEVDK